MLSISFLYISEGSSTLIPLISSFSFESAELKGSLDFSKLL